VAHGFLALKLPSAPVPDAVEAYWRDDGGAVAIVAGYVPATRAPTYATRSCAGWSASSRLPGTFG